MTLRANKLNLYLKEQHKNIIEGFCMSKQIDELLAKKMDRRDFIKHLGIGTLALFGLGTVVKLLSPVERKTSTVSTSSTAQTQSLGYGGGAYGGKRA